MTKTNEPPKFIFSVMDIHPLLPRQPIGRTFIVALVFLTLIAVLQVAAVLYALFDRVNVELTRGEVEQTVLVDPAIETQDDLNQELPAVDQQADSLRTEMVRPKGSRLDGRVVALVKQAREKRFRGDMQAAIVKLKEALALDEASGLALVELAATLDEMGLEDRAARYWRLAADLGPEAGVLKDLADLKLGGAISQAEPDFVEDAQGAAVKPGSTLGLIDVREVSNEQPEFRESHVLRIGLKARVGEEIDVRDVIIQVFFYDMVDGQHVVQTNADVSSQWTTMPADWAEDGIEVLEVSYGQPLAAEGEIEEDRVYLGYIVRVYYKDQLEDVRADPVRLLTLFPPPLEVEG